MSRSRVHFVNDVPQHVYQGYCANRCRTFVIGTVTHQQRALFDAFESSGQATLQARRPGVVMCSSKFELTAFAKFKLSAYARLETRGCCLEEVLSGCCQDIRSQPSDGL
jgi:Metallopeptidase family M24